MMHTVVIFDDWNDYQVWMREGHDLFPVNMENSPFENAAMRDEKGRYLVFNNPEGKGFMRCKYCGRWADTPIVCRHCGGKRTTTN
jgi:hypothetical protein